MSIDKKYNKEYFDNQTDKLKALCKQRVIDRKHDRLMAEPFRCDIDGTEIISRDKAEMLGLTRYYTAEPCSYGHICERYVDCYTCIQCNQERGWNQGQLPYTPPIITPELKEKRKLRAKHRRNIIKQATPLWFEKNQVNTIYEKSRMLAKLWDMPLHVDHIIPLEADTVCGLHCWDNLQILDRGLNIRKHKHFETLW